MAHLARPFAGRFFAEVQREGGVQSVANEINIDVQQIYDLVNGKALSTKDLRVIYVWLSVRVTLLPHEIEDFQKLVKDAIPASDVQVQPSSRERGVLAVLPLRARARVARRGRAIVLIAWPVSIAIVVVIALTIRVPASEKSAPGKTSSPQPSSPVASPVISSPLYRQR